MSSKFSETLPLLVSYIVLTLTNLLGNAIQNVIVIDLVLPVLISIVDIVVLLEKLSRDGSPFFPAIFILLIHRKVRPYRKD